MIEIRDVDDPHARTREDRELGPIDRLLADPSASDDAKSYARSFVDARDRHDAGRCTRDVRTCAFCRSARGKSRSDRNGSERPRATASPDELHDRGRQGIVMPAPLASAPVDLTAAERGKA
ncbi:MAG TPA: hypothetical protein VGQ86_03335 [Candidatus Limnocylindria bacterium]|jgi:hypothetical protein|nr:hypothetical protein [Candidatus Limnocylindria bacterium]